MSQAAVTNFVLGADGPVTNQEVTEATGLPASTVKVYLGRAVKKGDLHRLETGVYAIGDVPAPAPVVDTEAPISGTVVEGVIAQEGIPSGDGRMLERGSITWDGVLPVPLLWDRSDGDHTASVVGAVTEVERRGDDIWGRAILSDSADPETQAAVVRVAELFAEGAVGVSIMLDDDVHELRVKRELVEVEEIVDIDDDDIEIDPEEEPVAVGDGRVVVAKYAADDALDVTTYGRLRHVAVVDTAALLTEPEKRMAIAASGALADAKWSQFAPRFDDPKFGEPGTDERLRYDPGTGQWSCPPSVSPDGHVYGHVAAFGYCLRGRPDRCVTPPDGDLESFMRHYAPAAGGKRTGVICVGGGHAKTGVGPAEATRFYDNTGRAVADVRVGTDRYGIWMAGMTRPGATEEDIYAFKASDVSGHWEPDTNGRFRLVGLPAVNVGGFPKGFYTYDEVMQGLAAAADIEDCGEEVSEVTLAMLMSEIGTIKKAVATLYGAHLRSVFSED